MRNESGQTQIVAATVIGIGMVTGALYSMQASLKTNTTTIKLVQRSEMKKALERAAKHAAQLYRTVASCDPKLLDDTLGRLALDGSIATPDSAACPPSALYALPYVPCGGARAGGAGYRQMDVPVTTRTYRVSFGSVSRLPWRHDASPVNDPTVQAGPSYTSGTSQDALVEIWVSNQATSSEPDRITQIVALVNNCTTPCAVACPANPVAGTACAADPNACQTAWDSAVSYHRIPAGGYGGPLIGAPACNSAVPPSLMGDFNGDGRVDVFDLNLLRKYLRWGEGVNDPATGLPWNLYAPINLDGCADFNRDGIVNEIDLLLLEKYLRGWIYWLPVQ